MVGLILLCFFSGLSMGGYLFSVWQTHAFDARSEILVWPFGGVVLVCAFLIVGLWQARGKKKPLGLSKEAFVIATIVSYLAGAVGGVLM